MSRALGKVLADSMGIDYRWHPGGAKTEGVHGQARCMGEAGQNTESSQSIARVKSVEPRVLMAVRSPDSEESKRLV